jgi:hypothetical protein
MTLSNISKNDKTTCEIVSNNIQYSVYNVDNINMKKRRSGINSDTCRNATIVELIQMLSNKISIWIHHMLI